MEFGDNSAGNGKIKINFNRNDPAVKLQDQSQLLVAQYEWDGNRFVGTLADVERRQSVQ